VLDSGSYEVQCRSVSKEAGCQEVSHLGRLESVAMPSCSLLLTTTSVPRAEDLEFVRCCCWLTMLEVEGDGSWRFERSASDGAVSKLLERQKSARRMKGLKTAHRSEDTLSGHQPPREMAAQKEEGEECGVLWRQNVREDVDESSSG